MIDDDTAPPSVAEELERKRIVAQTYPWSWQDQQEPAIDARFGQCCHDCANPLDQSMGVMVWKGDGHGGVKQVPDRRDPSKHALRCMTCENKIQHPESHHDQRAGGAA